MTSDHGKFVWTELMTTDPIAATGFYRSVIGWRAEDAGMPDIDYTILLASDCPVGGLMELPAEACDIGAEPGWMGYIAVDDVDAYVIKVTQLGGKIYKEAEDIPGVGRFAIAGDPHGAAFALFRSLPEQAPPQAAQGSSGHVGWHELMAGDLDSAFAFYSQLFGWTKDEAIDMGPMGVYQIFAINGEPSGGIMTRPPEVPRPYWGFYVNVDDINTATARVKQHGGQIIHGPVEVPGGSWIINCLDPQSVAFSLIKPGPMSMNN